MQLSKLDWDYVLERSSCFTGRAWVFKLLEDFLSSPQGSFLIVGAPGTGKTAISSHLLLTSNAVHAAYLCRDGQVDILDCAQRLSDQLSDTVPGFNEVRLEFLARQIKVDDVHVQTGSVAVGASVSGVNINLAGLGPERAFTGGVSLPIRLLRDKGTAERIVILIDGLDEALASDATRDLVRLVAGLKHAHVIITSRPDRNILGLFEDRSTTVDLLSEAHVNETEEDIATYSFNRLNVMRDPQARETLAKRIAVEGTSNFLYAFHVLQSMSTDESTAGLTADEARSVKLPTGGLPGVYRAFLQRIPTMRDSQYLPMLSAITVAQGTGLESDDLLAIARRAKKGFDKTSVRRITKDIYQFLEGKVPDGPFRLYHRSFAAFLQDPRENPDFVIDAADAHAAIVETYLDIPRSEWTNYPWQHLFTHAYHLGKERSSYALLFQLADSGYLEGKLKQLRRFELVNADYDLLFLACASSGETGRLAGYGLRRSRMVSEHVVMETPGFLSLYLAAGDPKEVRRAFAELVNLAELILNPVHRAAVLMNLYECCPEPLWTSEEWKNIPESAWKLLEPIPKSNDRAYQLERLVGLVAVRQRERLAWAETLISAVSPSYISGSWAGLARGFLYWSDETGALRCLTKVLRYLPNTNVFSVSQFFGACKGLESAVALQQLIETAMEELARGLVGFKAAEFCAIASGLQARAGRHTEALRQMEQVFSIGTEFVRRWGGDEWSHAVLVSNAADALGEYSSQDAIAQLWKRSTAVHESFSGSAQRRIASRLTIARATHVRRGISEPASALEDAAALGGFELGTFGCTAALLFLIDGAAETKSLRALLKVRETLGEMEPARDRARIASRLIKALDSVDQQQVSSEILADVLSAFERANIKDRIGGGLALAGIGQNRGFALLKSMPDSEFHDLMKLGDDIDRTWALEAIFDTIKSGFCPDGTESILQRSIRECRTVDRKKHVLSIAAETAMAVLPPSGQRRAAETIRTFLSAPAVSETSIHALALAAGAFRNNAKPEQASQALRRALDLFVCTVNESSKYFAAGAMARACAQLEDRAALERMLDSAREVEEKYWSARAYGEVAEALQGGSWADLLESEAEKLLAVVDQIPALANKIAALGYIAYGLRHVPSAEHNFARLNEVTNYLTAFQLQGVESSLSMFEAWSSVASTQLRWGLSDEGVASVDNALACYERLTHQLVPPALKPFGDSLIALHEKGIRSDRIQRALDAHSLTDLGGNLVEQLCKSIGALVDRTQGADVLLACKRKVVASDDIEIRNSHERGFYRQDQVYTYILALTALATEMDRAGEVGLAADFFQRTLRLARQIKGGSFKAWSYARILERCGHTNPVRPVAESEAIETLPEFGEMRDRSSIAEAWLKTVQIENRETARQISRYLVRENYGRTNLIDAFPAILHHHGLGTGASLILEVAATFSPEDVLYAAALIAHEESTQIAGIDPRLAEFLEEAPAAFSL